MSRADRLAERLAERELDTLVVTDLMNLRYLTGFTGTNAICLIGPERRDFITDFRYVERAEQEVQGFERIRGERTLLADAAKRLSGRVGFEDQHMSVRTHAKLGELVGDGVELVAAGGIVEDLRAVKDSGELAAIRAAAALADDAFEAALGRGLAGRTERDFALDLEHEMRQRGAEDPSFPSIVAFAGNGALPHAEPREVEIERDTLVVCDYGAKLDGYCSDCTRTIATGALDGEAAEVYELVRAAQQKAVDAVAPGMGCKEVDGIARELIAAGGHGERFGHGLGHGVGLEVHEEPRLAQTADGELAAGMVVTVEPGVYVTGAFGVRIEDLVVVTDTGREILSRFPKALTVAGA